LLDYFLFTQPNLIFNVLVETTAMNRTTLLKLLLIVPFLMAFQCDEEELDPQYAFNTFKVSVSPESTFAVNDTIWIEGRVSEMVFNLTTNDSVSGVLPQSDVFSVYKLVAPGANAVTNTLDSFDQFIPIYDFGAYAYLPSCENAQVSASPLLVEASSQYFYRLGLKALTPGDYVISWQDASLANSERHSDIAANYAIPNRPNEIGFNACGSSSWRFLNASNREYFFRVE
jgi:hypothetical protein